jgi:hypothetical protein
MDLNDGPDASEIELSIDELVLHGVRLTDRARFEGALRRELARLIGSAPPRGNTPGRVDLRRPIDIQVGNRPTPGQLGQQVARAIHGALRR